MIVAKVASIEILNRNGVFRETAIFTYHQQTQSPQSLVYWQIQSLY